MNRVSRTQRRDCVICGKQLSRSTKGARCSKCRYEDPESVSESITLNTHGTTAHLNSVSPTIKTLEAALEAAEVNLTEWVVDGWTLNKYDQHSTKEGYKELWQVKVRLKRAVDETVRKAAELLTASAKEWKPAKGPRRRVSASDPHMAVFCPFDVHFGKLAWAEESGHDYDCDIAERVFANAVADTLLSAKAFNVAEWLVPIGQDWFHVDGWRQETANGTPMDTDGRWPKIFRTGTMAMAQALEAMAQQAPVVARWSPGNHDRTSSWHLCEWLRAWFKGDKRITVDTSPRARWYHEWGTNLIGVTHGKDEKKQALPTLMATESAEAWGRTTSHQWFVGHLHSKRALTTTPVEERDGVTVWQVSSLSGTDAWHFDRGYVGNKRAAETFLFSKDRGYAGHFVASAREV